jgi:hypothetical protein
MKEGEVLGMARIRELGRIIAASGKGLAKRPRLRITEGTLMIFTGVYMDGCKC